MADEMDVDTPMRTEDAHKEEDTPKPTQYDSYSESGSEGEEEKVEWLATSRAKRSTAGNRMTSLLLQEEPDEELEHIFAEIDDDVGFEDVEDQSDVDLDSSDDDDDQGPTAGAEDLDGERELLGQERQAKQTKKRKFNDGIPKTFKKRVQIDPSASQASAPRPKKKSERASWIPTADEAPTRASARGTTRQSKEQLHAQMIDREVKRLKQLANMEKAAAKKEAAKKPALTQEDRLKEAARVEKSNTKSLSRWELSEQIREEEQRLRLAALKNRQMDGPYVTFWSGVGVWIDGKLKMVGKTLQVGEVKEKPVVSKKRKAAEMDGDGAGSGQPTKLENGPSTQNEGIVPEGPLTESGKKPEILPRMDTDIPRTPSLEPKQNMVTVPGPSNIRSRIPSAEPLQNGVTVAIPGPSSTGLSPKSESEALSASGRPSPTDEVAPAIPAASNPTTPNPPIKGVPNDSNLPLFTLGTSHASKSPVLTPPPGLPITTPPPPPPPPPPPITHPSHPPFILAPPILDGSAPLPGFYNNPYNQPPPHSSHLMTSKATPLMFNHNANRQTIQEPRQPQIPQAPPKIEYAARNYDILSNFDEIAIKDKNVQTEIIFRQKFIKKPKPQTVLCAISGYPAKYRDPSTGLAYCNAFAYKEIQRLKRGDYHWSKLVGAYVGEGKMVARGVPPRFVNPAYTAPQQSALPASRASNSQYQMQQGTQQGQTVVKQEAPNQGL